MQRLEHPQEALNMEFQPQWQQQLGGRAVIQDMYFLSTARDKSTPALI